VLRVGSLWSHPVKSLQGRRVDLVTIDAHGVVGDRRWAIRDVATGTVLTGRRAPELLHAVGGDGSVTLPTGETTADSSVLSAWLGRSVELVAAQTGVRPTYEVPLDPLEGEQQWVSWQGPDASFVDSTKTAVSLISAQSIGSDDPRRFRMNVVLEGAAAPDEEVALVGARIAIGSAVLTVMKQVDRCVMVTRSQPGLERDLDVLRRVNSHHGGNLGIGALVEVPGSFGVGDEVRVLEQGPASGGAA
jgi:uncharacterized protein